MKRVASIILFIFCSISFISCREDIEGQRKAVRPISFEKQKWLGLESDGTSDAGLRWEYRPGMARYLVNNNILIGKSHLEVIDLLGEGYDGSEAINEMNYELIQIYRSNIDPIAGEDLRIMFNQQNKVEKSEIVFRKLVDWKE